nr:manganese efflux pump [Desmospora activa]
MQYTKKKGITMEIHSIIALVLISFASNVDNLGVGVAYGLRGRVIPPAALGIIGLIGGVIAGIAAEGGMWLKQWFPLYLSDWIAGGILVLIGLYAWVSSHKRATYYHTLVDKEWWFLAIGLSINNFAMGLSGGLLGFHSVIFGLCMGVVSSLMLWLGDRLGQSLGLKLAHPWVNQAGALLLILIGVMQLF